ncbi:MAG: DNA polymerase III subunit gamma/tau [Firmicutes bacterium]|nr:DNA polymerase III subunit gamma/tau [Bacillota bacterium]
MSTTSLYRKYRPQKFGDMIGQDYIVKILHNQIQGNKVSHAYLFCGSRGTGKTTTAKIFASELTDVLDIFEIDAASNNSVQDVRDITDKVKYPPVRGKYKIYIIDEVHMFSGAAFNAFLKTLEETPSHVIFILCTTEPHKILPTVQSRCLRFDFRSASEKDVAKLLERVTKKENILIDKESIALISTAAAGAYRDALSFLETISSFANGSQITGSTVAMVLGSVPPEVLNALLDSVKKCDFKKIIETCGKIFERGVNAGLLVRNMLEQIKQRIIKGEDYMAIFRSFSELELSIKNSVDPRASFENTCLVAGIDGNAK